MKKLFALVLLFIPMKGVAAFIPLTLSTGSITVPIGSTVAVVNAVGTNLGDNLTQVSGTTVLTTGATGQVPVAGGYPANGANAIPNPILIGAYTFSASVPPANVNGRVGYLMVDGFGRILTQGGVPNSLITRTTATLTTTTEQVLISSAGASTFSTLCGCLATNTSATNTYLTFRDQGNGGATAFTLGVPANMVPAGFGPDQCDHPIQQKTANSNWTIQAANAVTDIRISCWYFQSQ